MMIEFIGSTGSGKTTLISKVQYKLAKTTNVTTSFDLAASFLGLRSVAHPTARNLIEEFVGFPFFIRSLKRYKDFLICTYRMFSQNTKFSIHTINNLRSLERKIGVYEIIKSYGNNRVVLVDEGPMLAAHMFVFPSAPVIASDLAVFADLLPLPDLIVYIRAPIDTLIKRTMRRPDPPRELDINNLALTKNHVEKAVDIFDQLVKIEKIRNRLLVVNNPDLSKEEYSKLVNTVVEFILNHKTSVDEKTIK